MAFASIRAAAEPRLSLRGLSPAAPVVDAEWLQHTKQSFPNEVNGNKSIAAKDTLKQNNSCTFKPTPQTHHSLIRTGHSQPFGQPQARALSMMVASDDDGELRGEPAQTYLLCAPSGSVRTATMKSSFPGLCQYCCQLQSCARPPQRRHRPRAARQCVDSHLLLHWKKSTMTSFGHAARPRLALASCSFFCDRTTTTTTTNWHLQRRGWRDLTLRQQSSAFGTCQHSGWPVQLEHYQDSFLGFVLGFQRSRWKGWNEVQVRSAGRW